MTLHPRVSRRWFWGCACGEARRVAMCFVLVVCKRGHLQVVVSAQPQLALLQFSSDEYAAHSTPVPLSHAAATNLVEEHWVSNSMVDSLANLLDMRQAGADMPAAVTAIVTAALNHRGADVATRLPPFAEVLKAAVAAPAPVPLSASELAEGLVHLARSLHMLADDMPKVGLWQWQGAGWLRGIAEQTSWGVLTDSSGYGAGCIGGRDGTVCMGRRAGSRLYSMCLEHMFLVSHRVTLGRTTVHAP